MCVAPPLEHLHDRPQHTRHRPERRIILTKPPDAEEVPEQLVGAIDEVNDHVARTLQGTVSRGERGEAEKTGFLRLSCGANCTGNGSRGDRGEAENTDSLRLS